MLLEDNEVVGRIVPTTSIDVMLLLRVIDAGKSLSASKLLHTAKRSCPVIFETMGISWMEKLHRFVVCSQGWNVLEMRSLTSIS